MNFGPALKPFAGKTRPKATTALPPERLKPKSPIPKPASAFPMKMIAGDLKTGRLVWNEELQGYEYPEEA